MDPLERMFIHYHQELDEQDKMKQLLKALGIIWSKSELQKAGSGGGDSDTVFIPLAATINPNIFDLVLGKNAKTAKQGEVVKAMSDGTPIDSSMGQVRSMAELSKEEFYKLIGQPIPSSLPHEEKEKLKRYHVTKEG